MPIPEKPDTGLGVRVSNQPKAIEGMVRQADRNAQVDIGERTSSLIAKPIVRYQFIYSIGGLVLGLATIIGGVVLFLHGITGSTSWTTEILNAHSEITDAAPGAVLFVVGLFLVWVTRYHVKTK